MAENSPLSLEQPSLQDVLAEIRQQRVDVQALRDEFKGTAESVASEVRKIKTSKDIKWKFQGNQIQYDFNISISDIIVQLVWSIEHRKLDYSLDLCKDISDLVKKRNKLIRIADSSSGGWETVRQYESNPVASDSDDEAKIIKAENRALKRKKGGHSNTRCSSASSPSVPSTGNHSGQHWRPGPFTPSFQPASGRGKFFRGPSNNYQSNYPGGFRAPAPGPCFACGEFSHFRKDCPYILRPNVPTGEQTQGEK